MSQDRPSSVRSTSSWGGRGDGGLLANSSLPAAGRSTHSRSAFRIGRDTRALSNASASTTASHSRSRLNLFSNLGTLEEGYFDHWTRGEIVEALIRDGQTLRDENYLTVSVLRSFATRVFEDREPPPKPQTDRPDIKRMKNDAAMSIQNAWFGHLIKKAEREPAEVAHGSSLHSNGRRSFGNVATDGHTNFEEVVQELHIPTVPEEGEYDESSDDEEKSAATRGILEQPWVPPSWEYARMYAAYNHPRKGGLGGSRMPVLRTSTGRHCMSTGWGEQCDLWEEKQVSELGRYGPGITNYFKFLKWAFWVFVILSMLCFPTLVMNTFGRGDEQGGSLNDLSQTMVGNLGDANVTQTVSYPGCNDQVRGQNCDFDKKRLALFYAYIDFGATIVVIIAFIWLRIFEVREEVVLNKNTVSVANYTVAVKGFQKGLEFTEQELKTHFAEITGQAVSTVAVAYDNEKEIQLYKKRGELMKARVSSTQEYRYYRSLQRAGQKISQDFLTDVLSRRVECTAKMRDIDVETDRLHQVKDQPIYAFVTFEQPIGSRVAIRAYNYSVWAYLTMKNSLKFKGSKIIVQPASEPSTILWENLRYRRFDRRRRRLLTTSITLVLLTISVIANIVARALEQSASDRGGDEVCPDDFFDWSDNRQQAEVENNDQYLHCYCDQFSQTEQRNDSLCKEYFEKNLIADFFVYFACFIVLITNGGIDMFLKASAEYEKHHSADSMEKSIFVRMFLLKFINTGVVFLFMNLFARINAVFGISYHSSGDFTTQWYQTTGVSICLVQIGDIVSPHMWKLYKFYDFHKKLKAAAADPLNRALTQDDLNQLHLGPDFYVSHRYAQIMADFFVCYMFCIGMPILPIIAVFNFYVSYWVDKFLFLRYYRSPPRYTSNIGRMATGLIPYAIVVHLAVSIWTLGNRDIFFSGDQSTGGINGYTSNYGSTSVSDKISQKHTFPLFILMIVVVLGILLGQVTERIIKILQIIAKACCGSCLAQSEFYQEIERFLFNTIHISYSRAVRRGIIKGLATYNILQNPKYKEAFGITDGFAVMHGRVKSLKHFAQISFEGIQELERASRTSSIATDTLASSDLVNLANQRFNDDRSTLSSMESGSVRSSVRSQRPSRVLSDETDDRSVTSESNGPRLGATKNKKDKRRNKAKERNDIVMGALDEDSDEYSEMETSVHTARTTPRVSEVAHYSPREVVGVLIGSEESHKEATGVLVHDTKQPRGSSDSKRSRKKSRETVGVLVEPAAPTREFSDPQGHHPEHTYSAVAGEEEDITRTFSEKLPAKHGEWQPGMSAQLAAASGLLPPLPGGRKVEKQVPHPRNISDPFKGSLYSAAEDIDDDCSVHSARTAPRKTDVESISGSQSVGGRHHRRGSSDPSQITHDAAGVYGSNGESANGGMAMPVGYQRACVTDEDMISVPSPLPLRPHVSPRGTSDPHRPSHQTIASAPRRSSRPGSRGSTPPMSSTPSTSCSPSRSSSAGIPSDPALYYATEDIKDDDMQSVQSAPIRALRRVVDVEQLGPSPGIGGLSRSRPPSAHSSEHSLSRPGSAGIAARISDEAQDQTRYVWSPKEDDTVSSAQAAPSPPPAQGKSQGAEEDDTHSVQSMVSAHSIRSALSRPSAVSTPRTPSVAGHFTFGPDIDRQTPLSAAQTIIGEQRVMLGTSESQEDSYGRRPLEEVGRPLSAYVDIRQSYDHSVDAGAGHMDEENPMTVAAQSPEKTTTLHSYFTPQASENASHTAPIHRRPSPVDAHNIEEFKRGRRSKRASGKTQL